MKKKTLTSWYVMWFLHRYWKYGSFNRKSSANI